MSLDAVTFSARISSRLRSMFETMIAIKSGYPIQENCVDGKIGKRGEVWVMSSDEPSKRTEWVDAAEP
jgi:hypothetical protein